MHLHSYEPRNRKRAWKALSEGLRHGIIGCVQTVFSGIDHTLQKAPVIGKVADAIRRFTRKHGRGSLKNAVTGEDIIVVHELYQKGSQRIWSSCQEVQQRKMQTLWSPESKTKMNNKVKQKVKNVFMISEPPCRQVNLSSKCRSMRSIRPSEWEKKGFWWAISIRRWNSSSRFCLHICNRASYRKAVTPMCLTLRQIWRSFVA